MMINDPENKQQYTQQQEIELKDTNHTTQTNSESTTSDDQYKPLGFLSTVKSVVGAMFGVQSEEQREKDFEKADPVKLILGAIVFVILFIMTILWVVRTALENATP